MKKIFRKLHLWLSVPFGLIITIICFTGAALVFENEIMELLYPSRYFVKEVKQQPIPLEDLLLKVSNSLPDSVSVSGVTIFPDSKRAYQVNLSKPRRASVYVDQYTAEVKPQFERSTFFMTMFRAHRWLLDSMKPGSGIFWGKMIVGVSTLVFVFVLITGIVIWIPRTRKSLKQRLKISTKHGWLRFWHDLHVSGGIYVTIVLLTLALTGLTWSFGWYRTGFYKVFGAQAQQMGGHGAPGQQAQPQAQNTAQPFERSGRPEGIAPDSAQLAARGERGERTGRGERGSRGERSGRPDSVAPDSAQLAARGERGERTERGERGSRGERGGRPDSVAPDSAQLAARGERGERTGRGEGGSRGARGGRPDGAERSNDGFNASMAQQTPDFTVWQKVYHQLSTENPNFKQISVTANGANVSFNGWGNQRASDSYSYDQTTGKITNARLYKDQTKAAKLRGWIFTVHVGSWGGMLTRILTFIAALVGASLPITGYYLWYKRSFNKKKRKTKDGE